MSTWKKLEVEQTSNIIMWTIPNMLPNMLHDACRKGDLDKVKRALSEGVEHNCQDEDGWTSIMLACYYYHPDIVRYIIDNTNIDVNIGNNVGETCLMWASIQNKVDLVKVLIEDTDINVNTCDTNAGWTCLMMACHKDCTESVKFLIENTDIDVNISDSIGMNCLMLACMYNSVDSMKVILSHIENLDMNKVNKEGNTCLIMACFYGNIEMVNLIIGYGNDINLYIKNKDNKTALDFARDQDKTDIIKLIEEMQREQDFARETIIAELLEETQTKEENKKKKKRKKKKCKSPVVKEASSLNSDFNEVKQEETLNGSDLNQMKVVVDEDSALPSIDLCVETPSNNISTNYREMEKVIEERQIAFDDEIENSIKTKDKEGISLNCEKEKINYQIKEKQEQIIKQNEMIQSLIDSKSKENKNLIVLGDKAANSANLKLNKITNNDKKILEYESMIEKLRELNKLAKIEHQQCMDQAKRLSGKQQKLDDYIAAQMEQSSMEVIKIDNTIVKLRQGVDDIDKKLENIAIRKVRGSTSDEPVNDQSHQLLKFIDNQITEKEDELECPVCLEVCTSSPIFMCEEMHLICSICRPKVIKCPQCRNDYKAEVKRHRFAEKTLEELAKLRNCRSKLNKDT